MIVVLLPITSADLWSLPEEDTLERWLIDGELRERPVSLRSPAHCKAVASQPTTLCNWCRSQPRPWNEVLSTDIDFRLRRNPDTNGAVDVAVARADQVMGLTPNTRFIEGAPLLAVEVFSASDVPEDVHEKIGSYLQHGTSMVWIVDPFDQTVKVYQPDVEPVMFSRYQESLGDPVLQGFRCGVADLFFE